MVTELHPKERAIELHPARSRQEEVKKLPGAKHSGTAQALPSIRMKASLQRPLPLLSLLYAPLGDSVHPLCAHKECVM